MKVLVIASLVATTLTLLAVPPLPVGAETCATLPPTLILGYELLPAIQECSPVP